MRAVAVGRVAGVFASTQPNCGVFLWDEAKRGEALGSGFVASIAERLLPAVPTGAPRVMLPTNQLRLERLLSWDDRFRRTCGQLDLGGCRSG